MTVFRVYNWGIEIASDHQTHLPSYAKIAKLATNLTSRQRTKLFLIALLKPRGTAVFLERLALMNDVAFLLEECPF